jgi:hypothetical protein
MSPARYATPSVALQRRNTAFDRSSHGRWTILHTNGATIPRQAKSLCAPCIGGETHHVSESASHFDVTRIVATRMTAAMATIALETTAGKIKPTDANSFRRGDAVAYTTHGIGRIARAGFAEITGYLQLDPHLVRGRPNDVARSYGLGARCGWPWNRSCCDIYSKYS